MFSAFFFIPTSRFNEKVNSIFTFYFLALLLILLFLKGCTCLGKSNLVSFFSSNSLNSILRSIYEEIYAHYVQVQRSENQAFSSYNILLFPLLSIKVVALYPSLFCKFNQTSLRNVAENSNCTLNKAFCF